jgi:hypothetical protein
MANSIAMMPRNTPALRPALMFSWLKPTSVLWHGAHVAPLQYQQTRLPQFFNRFSEIFYFLPHCDEPNPLLFRSDFKRLQRTGASP